MAIIKIKFVEEIDRLGDVIYYTTIDDKYVNGSSSSHRDVAEVRYEKILNSHTKPKVRVLRLAEIPE